MPTAHAIVHRQDLHRLRRQPLKVAHDVRDHIYGPAVAQHLVGLTGAYGESIGLRHRLEAHTLADRQFADDVAAVPQLDRVLLSFDCDHSTTHLIDWRVDGAAVFVELARGRQAVCLVLHGPSPPRLALRHGKVHTLARCDVHIPLLCRLSYPHRHGIKSGVRAVVPAAIPAECRAFGVRAVNTVLLAVEVLPLCVVLNGADAYRLCDTVVLLFCWVRVVRSWYQTALQFSHVRINSSRFSNR